MKKIVPLRPFDYAALGLAAAVTLGASFAVYAGSGASEEVVITGERDRWVFPRDAVETLAVPGPLGDTVVELREGSVRITASPCANQTCIAAGAVRSHGQWIACLPNRVLVSVSAGDKDAGSSQGLDEIDGAAW
ncbi:MAG: NusG domain II-containing protein [Treponema sp.]|jgi:hypothetical protein|nr:NusG domain II-containing protein [Treponema sp.]